MHRPRGLSLPRALGPSHGTDGVLLGTHCKCMHASLQPRGMHHTHGASFSSSRFADRARAGQRRCVLFRGLAHVLDGGWPMDAGLPIRTPPDDGVCERCLLASPACSPARGRGLQFKGQARAKNATKGLAIHSLGNTKA